ncbi:MAG TPA: M12 family metallo-peptidase [Thermoanaerobaculia bacterium]|nr:M12 family metallo-peptidase [Thermoanaerobaculia bacterium]
MKSLHRLIGACLVVAMAGLSGLAADPAEAAQAASPAGTSSRLSAGARGQVVMAPGADPGAEARGEVVTFGDGLVPSLLRVPANGEVRIEGWPVAPEERADVALTRFEVYAPDARVWTDNGKVRAEVPRSRLLFFRGQAEDDPETRVFVAVDPAAATLSGITATPDGTMREIRPLREVQLESFLAGAAIAGLADGPGEEYLVGTAEPVAGRTPEEPLTCDQTGAPLELLQNQAEATTTQPIFAEAITSLHSATIAVETDNELINGKFGGNATTATNYIATLFAQMSVIYERDLLVRLLQGHTILRTGTTDPYTSTGSTADKMFEFGNYWSANYSSVSRATAIMLSGRGTAGAAGVAWIDVLCSKSNGYAYNQLFTSGTSVSVSEVMIVAHEIGHNFGSPHTHCYNPPLDNCYNTASGCYAGTKTCPAPTTINGVAGVTGTLMSYCHLGGIGCATHNVFHPGSVALLQPKIQARVNTCIFPVGGNPPPVAPTVSTVSPASGTTAGGTAVTITGTGFQSGATVTFGGTAASVTFNSSTRLTVTTPARASGSVAVVVTNPGGLNASRNPGFFYSAPSVASDFYTVTPCRLLDTRNANGSWGGPVLGPSVQRTFTATGRCGIPAGATAVAANVTVYQPTALGTVSAFPGNAFDLGTIAVGFHTGAVRANNNILRMATDGSGTVGFRNNSAGNTHLIVDVFGYFVTSTAP